MNPACVFPFRFSSRLRVFAVLFSLFLILGCSDNKAQPTVVVYTSVDQPVAAAILKSFTDQTGIAVDARYDTEANKSVGLAEKVRAEKANPQCDVWWGNEIFLTIRLAEEGLLQPYESPAVADVPGKFKDAQHRWASNGMRVRVIAARGRHSAAPRGFLNLKGIEGLTDPTLKGSVVMARPTAGTTAGHVAALYSAWGDARADAYFRALHANDIKLLGGNAMVVQSVGGGQAWAGLTDNDDIDAVGGNVTALLPDQGDGGLGTLAIPCTVGLIANRPPSPEAKKLVDFLLSKDVEQQLIAAKFVKFSVRAGPGEIRTMDVDYPAVAKIMPRAMRRATALLEGREE